LQWAKLRTLQYTGIRIFDYQKSFEDGKALCALLHSYDKESFNYDEMLNTTSLEKISFVLDLGERLYGIPAICSAQSFFIGNQKKNKIEKNEKNEVENKTKNDNVNNDNNENELDEKIIKAYLKSMEIALEGIFQKRAKKIGTLKREMSLLNEKLNESKKKMYKEKERKINVLNRKVEALKVQLTHESRINKIQEKEYDEDIEKILVKIQKAKSTLEEDEARNELIQVRTLKREMEDRTQELKDQISESEKKIKKQELYIEHLQKETKKGEVEKKKKCKKYIDKKWRN